MVRGIKITQHVFKNDDSDMTDADADDLFGAFLDACVAREFHTGGEVRLVDDEGVILKGGFRNVEARDFPCTLQPIPVPNAVPDETRMVWKYPVPLEDHFILKMPVGAQVLCVQIQRESVQLWALVYPNRALEEREFYTFGTGHPINVPDASLRYVDTYQRLEGALVLHLFEVLK